MKNNRGEITIPMILTGIILIVAVGICIFMLTGENGLFILNTEKESQENQLITNNTTNSDEQNVTDNENGALIVPAE